MIRVIKIDALHQTVTEIEIQPTLADFYAVIGCKIMEVGCSLPNGDMIYVDEEGAMNDVGYGFQMPRSSNKQPFLGNGCVVGKINRNGNDSSSKSLIDEITATIKWWDE